MSLDPPFIPEFAERRLPRARAGRRGADAVTDGVVQGALDGASWDGELVAVPFWANTQLLWYRKSVAAGGGLDMSKPGDLGRQLIKAAQSQDTRSRCRAAVPSRSWCGSTR